ncbi:MAG: ATP-binding protein [Candidatus Eremiobacteraeota bacterium]|nr:ATP-binding protein [Candidatus Eremiobacteraeota bacterium]
MKTPRTRNDSDMERKILVRYFILFFLPIALIITASTYTIYVNEENVERVIFEREEEKTVGRITRGILSDLHVVISDFLILSEKRELREPRRFFTASFMDNLKEEYLVSLKMKEFFEELTLLDAEGKEALRLVNSKGNPFAVPQSELADREKFPHFIESAKGGKWEIYISPVMRDSQEERRPGEHPHLSLYIGKPIYDMNNEKWGVLLVKYYADQILNHFERLSINSEGHVMLADSTGVCFMDSMSENSFALKSGLSLEQLFPLEWTRIMAGDSGQFLDRQGLFTFKTVFPPREALRLAAGPGYRSDPADVVPEESSYCWKIISFVPRETLSLPIRRISRDFIIFEALLLVLLAFISFYIARAQASRRLAENALKESEKRYSTLVEQAKDGIIIMREGTISFANRAMGGICGYRPERLVGMNVSDIVLDEAECLLSNACSTRFLDEHSQSLYEMQMRCDDGSLKVVGISAGTICFHDELSVMWVVRDISERKRAEDELKRVREEFLATLTHDMKTPLTSMMGYIGLVANPRFGEVPRKKLDYIKTAEYLGRILLVMINNVIHSSKIETGHMDYHCESFLLSELIGELKATFGSHSLLSGVNNDFSCPEDTWVRADRPRIREVFYNLISNAYRYTPEGGTVAISVVPAGEDISIRVSDTGSGITRSDQEKIFDKYGQGHGERRGTGLGLHIVKKILEGHGKEIKVESTPGEGTAFTFSLQKGQRPVEALPRRNAVLIVGDEAKDIESLAKMLSAEGYPVETAERSGDAVEKIHSLDPGLVVIFRRPSDCDTLEFMDLLGSSTVRRKLPAVLISQEPSIEAVESFSLVIPLPLDIQYLTDEVRILLA